MKTERKTLEFVLPFLSALTGPLTDPDVTEIMVQEGGRKVFIEKDGKVRHEPTIQLDSQDLAAAIKSIARLLGEDWSEDLPMLDSRLDDGSRVTAVCAPVSVDGVALTIRRFGRRYSLRQLVAAGMLPASLCSQLVSALVDERRTVLIAGGCGTGKTTLLNALADTIPDDERVVLLEDTAEIHLERTNLLRLNTRREGFASLGLQKIRAVTMADLLRFSLRLRPDRIIVGEVRGGEAFQLLQALNTGHQGSLSTLHANSSIQALDRFAWCVQESGTPVPYDTVCSQIATVGLVVVYLVREQGRRTVVEAQSVDAYSPRSGWTVTTVYHRDVDDVHSQTAAADRSYGASEVCSASSADDQT